MIVNEQGAFKLLSFVPLMFTFNLPLYLFKEDNMHVHLLKACSFRELKRIRANVRIGCLYMIATGDLSLAVLVF